MSTPPKLSVVTVTYNDVPGLDLTLGSLGALWAAWPAPEWEHVVVDGSPALSRPLLDALPAGWPLIHVTQSPAGVPEALNQGLAVAGGAYVWFLNGGDALRDLTALSKMLAALEGDRTVDFVCGGAYLHRHRRPLYPAGPWRTSLGNLLGRNWMYHQAVVYRRASLTRIGFYSTAYRTAMDYDYHFRCYVAGLRGLFSADVLVDYDMGGSSNDVVAVFREFKTIQRSYAGELPAWVNGANEIVRRLEYTRILVQRRLSTTWLGTNLRPFWAKLNRWIRQGRPPPAS